MPCQALFLALGSVKKRSLSSGVKCGCVRSKRSANEYRACCGKKRARCGGVGGGGPGDNSGASGRVRPPGRAGLGRDWEGRWESTMDLEAGVMPCTFEKEQRGQCGWGGGGLGVEKFHGDRRLKEGFQLSLEGSVFLEFLDP